MGTKNNYIVYKHTSPNNKVYIGITMRECEDRWKNGLGYKSNKRLFHDIIKYGWNNFIHEILYDSLSFEEAKQKEIELIAYYKSDDCEYGYNQVKGMRGYKRPDHVRNRIRQSMKKIAVSQFTLSGDFIATYESGREAERRTGVYEANILACCKGKNHTAGGFIWKYANEN